MWAYKVRNVYKPVGKHKPSIPCMVFLETEHDLGLEFTLTGGFLSYVRSYSRTVLIYLFGLVYYNQTYSQEIRRLRSNT